MHDACSVSGKNRQDAGNVLVAGCHDDLLEGLVELVWPDANWIGVLREID